MSESPYDATGQGWVLDSINFMKQVCIDVGSHASPCTWVDDALAQETTFWIGDRQLGGWQWEGLRHAIENGYSRKFCETMVRQLKLRLHHSTDRE